MSTKSDVLVLGATGFTGRLITQYLCTHRERASFTLTLAARNKARLDALVADCELGSGVTLLVVDVTRAEQVEDAVRSARVVLNTVGPFWTWGTPVVKACVKYGVHCTSSQHRAPFPDSLADVDLTGETEWIKRIIIMCDYPATKTGAIIVPSCGFDSVPADITTYLASQTLHAISGTPLDIDTSVTAYAFRGGFSGGTVATAITQIEQMPADKRAEAAADYSLSPVLGRPSPRPPLIYRLVLPDTRRTLVGAFFFMRPSNRAVVQRTVRYGPAFTYDEFMVTGGAVSALVVTFGLVVSFGCMMISPLRWLLKKVLPQPGEGPSESVRKNGFMKVTNLTTSAHPPIQVKTTMQGAGDPGYSLTSVIISEAALALALTPPEALPPLARRGGVLTPATALGDVLVARLKASGRVEFESTVVAGLGRWRWRRRGGRMFEVGPDAGTLI
ncbi:Saccharopine dehydrogenase-domain-containing protein [Mycena sp. CBHHK59/15]|nr:Saccharopine dehydrogenase-domain-containing protein [Mycena sp. CBHHK59/15]